MLKPNENEFSRALDAARYMRAHDLDHHYLAKTLLYFAQRNEMLEKVVSAAESCLHFGLGAAERAELTRAVAHVKRAEVCTGSRAPSSQAVVQGAL